MTPIKIYPITPPNGATRFAVTQSDIKPHNLGAGERARCRVYSDHPDFQTAVTAARQLQVRRKQFLQQLGPMPERNQK